MFQVLILKNNVKFILSILKKRNCEAQGKGRAKGQPRKVTEILIH